MWGSSAGILPGGCRCWRQHHGEGCAYLPRGAGCITQPPGHSHLLDPQRTIHTAPKTELGKVQVVLFKTSSLSILYTKRSVYLEVTLKEPQLRIKKKKQNQLIKGHFRIILYFVTYEKLQHFTSDRLFIIKSVLILVFADPLFKMLPLAINTCNECVNYPEGIRPLPLGSGLCLLVSYGHTCALAFPINLSDAKCLFLLEKGTDFYPKRSSEMKS